MNKIKLLFLIIVLIFTNCKNLNRCHPNNQLNFNADSAYSYIEKQVSFGPRVPNTNAHDSCAIYLSKKLESFGAKVYIQKVDVRKYDSTIMHIQNIIGEFYPEKKRRIILYSHWDSRFYADGEVDSLKRNHPIPGANDGGSGVAVLLEIARQLHKIEPKVGVDIIFFDAEDQGEPLSSNVFNEKSWSIGAQYWAKHPHKKNYKAFFGLNLDLAGAKGAMFCREDNSRYFDNFSVKRIWKLAQDMGYDNYFFNDLTRPVINDHVFINKIAGIKSVLIVDNRPGHYIPYFKEWHTSKDNINIIDKKTLDVVGNVVIQYIYCLE